MKQHSSKWITLVLSLMISQVVIGQSYSVKVTSMDDGYFSCEMNNFIKNIENTEIELTTYVKLEVSSANNRCTIFKIHIASWREDIGALFNATTVQSDGLKYKKRVIHKIYLENGELLSTNDAALYDIRREGWYQGTNVGIGFVGGNCLNIISNKIDMTKLDDMQKHQYVAQQLRNYSITKVVIDNVTINFTNFKTKNAYSEIFDALGKETGHPECFVYNGINSPGISNNEAKARIEKMKIVVFSDGEIGCHLKNVDIDNAIGENIRIEIRFMSQEMPDHGHRIDEYVEPQYQSSHWDNLYLYGNVKNFNTLRGNRGRYKASAILAKKIDNNRFKIIGESEPYFITIYYENGEWKYY